MKACWEPDFPTSCEGVSKSNVRLVALAIADVVNDAHHNEFYGSLTRVAERSDVDRKVVGLVVAHLVSAGVLGLIEHRQGRTSRYRWLGIDPRRQTSGTPDTRGDSPREPWATDPANPRTTVIETQESLTGCEPPTAAPPSAWTIRALDRACGERKCPAERGEMCPPGGSVKRAPSGLHLSRIAWAVATAWYDEIKERTGAPPASPSMPAVANLSLALLKTDRHPGAIAEALAAQ